PIKFGPKGYGNLPGLIMELQEGNLNYYASKLVFNPKKKTTVKKPNKGKLVTKDEFDKISERSGNWDK
ncbi:GLPGLI family protein, partial [Halomonas marinisediminis]